MNQPTITNHSSSHPSRTLLFLGFAVIYIVWGSTYLAIRVVVESMPPFLSAAARFLVAGFAMMAFLVWRGMPLPTKAQWKIAAIIGVLLTVGGNGLVVWAEQSISSGLAALLVALTPMWFALLEWLRPGGNRPDRKTVLGIVVGFAGVILLVSGRSEADSHGGSLWAALAVVAAAISWSAGSLVSKHAGASGSPWMNAAAQMICGGTGLLLVALCFGEPIHTDWSRITTSSMVALVYLVVMGSWLGFSVYVWLLRVSTPSLVSTYAYVNPVIAVFLGWLILDERLSPRMLAGALVVVAGVVAITIPRNALAAIPAKLARIRSGASARKRQTKILNLKERES